MAYTGDELQKIMREHILSAQLLSDSMMATAENERHTKKKPKASSKWKTKLQRFFSKLLHRKRKGKLLQSCMEHANTINRNVSTQTNHASAIVNGSFTKNKKLQRHLAMCKAAPHTNSDAGGNDTLSMLQVLPQNGVKLKAALPVSCPNAVCHTAILQLLQYQLANMHVMHSMRTLRRARLLYCPIVQPQTKVNILRATYTRSAWQKLQPMLCISYQMPAKPADCRRDDTADAWAGGEACCSTTFNSTTATQYVKQLDAAQGFDHQIIELLHNLLETHTNNSRSQRHASESLMEEASTNANAHVETHDSPHGIRLLLMPIPEITYIRNVNASITAGQRANEDT